MKVSELWLREWVRPTKTLAQLAEELTMAGLEVDGVYPVAGEFQKVVVAKVVRTMPHPEADKLTLCEVDMGASTLVPVVCGAQNVRANLMVALALPGASLPGGIHIKESVIRGQTSKGMLCSTAELGMEDSALGILELAEDAPIGVSLRDYLQLDDHVLDIDLTPNRADCFSILGVAREIAALNQLPLQTVPREISPPVIDQSMKITLQAPEACPKYCGRIIRGINTHALTPFWMKERLRRSGLRAIHPVVDVTNYVMLELGQPMHAFDLQTLDGQINVRFAHEKETLVLLDGQEVTLNEKVLVIADDHKSLAMAGVMGGEASSVQEHTTDIFLESAYFNPKMIAGVARFYGLSSDSSQRFERGVDPSLQMIGLERATQLLQSIVGGEVGPVVMESNSHFLPSHETIVFHPEQVKKITGLLIAEERMEQILKSLGMSLIRKPNKWLVEVPPHRFDLTLEVDLVEEIIRHYGYDNIEEASLDATICAGQINRCEQLIRNMSDFLCHRGYHETISYSFVDPSLQQAFYPDTPKYRLLNPISEELSEMRVSLWPGLIASMVYNANRQQKAIRLFESGVVFDKQEDRLQEHAVVAGLLMGEKGSLNWSDTTRAYDFYDLKGDLEALFQLLNVKNIQFVSDTHKALHPGKTARILVGEKQAGWIGVLHPQFMDELDLTTEVIVFELLLLPFTEAEPVSYRHISKYPQIRRDLSLLVDLKITSAEIEAAVREVITTDWLKAFDVFDVYTGESIPTGKKSLAISLTLQDDHRTLIDAEINTLIDSILHKLADEFAIVLRADTHLDAEV